MNQSLLQNIEEALAELGPVSNLSAIQQGLRSIAVASNGLPAHVYVSAAVAANRSHPFWQLCPSLHNTSEAACGPYNLQLCREYNLPPKKLGSPAPALALVGADENLLHEEQLLHHLKRHAPQYAALLILNYTGDEAAARSLRFEQRGRFEVLDGNAVSTSLDDLLDEHLPQEIREKLKEKSGLNTVQPVLQLTKETVQQELHLAALRKNINAQLGTVLRKDETELNINDTVNSVKTALQYWNSDAEKAVKIKYEELNKPSTGRYSQQLNRWSEALQDLERSEIAEKAERLVTRIAPAFLQGFEGQISSEVQTDFANDYNLLLSAADSALGKLNYQLEQKGVVPPGARPLALDYSRFPNPDKTLRNYIGFNRSYAGELGKKGTAEYFAALREHTGSIMVAVGLLAPLNMIASASSGEASEDKEGFFASISAFFKHMNNGIRIATAIIIVIMIIWGYFDLRKRIPRKRQEEFERELKKARENLQAEGRRMFAEASKDWQNSVSQWLREAYGQLQVQLDKAIRDYTGNQQTHINEQRARLQRLNQGLDNNSRRISNAERMIDGAIRLHRDAVSDLEKAFR